jgi:hypothetical protein
MCLRLVKQTKDLPKWGIGYKVVLLDNKSLLNWKYAYTYLVGNTYHDKNEELILTQHDESIYSERFSFISNSLYRAGFHIFKSKHTARCYWNLYASKVLKVSYSQITVIGSTIVPSGCDDTTIVARRMKVLEDLG